MGSFEMFLLLIFVFWILEGIAKARQRPRTPDATGQGGPAEQQVPSDRSQRAPSLLEVLAAEMQRAKDAQRQATQAKPAERQASQAKPVEHPALPPQHGPPTPRKAPVRGAQPVGSLRRALKGPPARGTPPTRLVAKQKSKTELVLRGEGVDAEEQFAERDREERTSDLWETGLRDSGRRAVAREVEQGAQSEADRAAALEAKRGASLEAAPTAGRTGLQRPSIKESQRPLGAAPPRAPKVATVSLDPRRLIGASPAELRRILVLQEVLGPPVGLRDDR